MLYFLHGNDIVKILEKSKSLIEAMLSKKPNASLFRIDGDNWSKAEFQEFLSGQGLFEQKYIVSISRILEQDEIKEVVLQNIDAMQSSDNIFIWTEESVDSKVLKKIEKIAQKIQNFEINLIPKKPEFNIFSLGDALGNRDKKKLWMSYIEALNYFVVEEIHGTLLWQVKNMLLASKTGNLKESGLKPFVFNKAKKFNENYKEDELLKLSSSLIKVSHDARRGKHDFKIAMERFILSI